MELNLVRTLDEDTRVSSFNLLLFFSTGPCMYVCTCTNKVFTSSSPVQVENAPKKSREAKLVKLADKLYNLRDLQRETPQGWEEERVQQYYVWAGEVVEGLLGTNDRLEKELETLLKTRNVKLNRDDDGKQKAV